MKIKHNEIEIPKENPFLNCKLDRKKYASILTTIVKTYSEGFVMSVNNKWGTGKTTFIKMWNQVLINDGFKTLYLNAWENDFDERPLSAILSELKSLESNPNSKKIFKQIISKGSVFSKKALPTILKGVAKQIGADELIQELVKGATESATEILNEEVELYTKKKKGLKEFRIILEEYIVSLKTDKPVVFIVDELDRCRPDYAVFMLEQIKHFFSVEGIVFILSIDKEQLGHAIKGVYGTNLINTEEYLRRFIDIEYSIPMPKAGNYCTYLYNYFSYDDFMLTPERSKHHEFKLEKKDLLSFATNLFERKEVTLRQQEKVFAYGRIVLNSFSSNHILFPDVYILLIFIKVINTDNLYGKINNKELTIQELVTEIEKVLPDNLERANVNIIIACEARLLCLYNNYKYEGHDRMKLKDLHSGGTKETLTFLTKYITIENRNFFERVIDLFIDNWNGVSLGDLLKKIDLTEDIRI